MKRCRGCCEWCIRGGAALGPGLLLCIKPQAGAERSAAPDRTRQGHMPTEGKCWRHVIIGTHGSWLPGSPKGWRSRGHRIHSSGDYKQPPPEGEHEGLYRFHLARCPDAITISQDLRPVIGKAFIKELTLHGHEALAIAVSGQHCHVLVELPQNRSEMKSEIGRAKRKSSRAVKGEMPGSVWAAGGKFIVIDSQAYKQRVFEYILRHHQEGAWVWSFRDD